MRHFALRPTVLLILGTSLAAAVQSFFDFDTDFLPLPESARQCLDNSASFSGNGGDFVTKTAACVGSSDPDDLGDVYDGLSKHCADSETPLSVGKADFMKSSGVTTTRTQTKTSSTIMQPTSTGETRTTATSETTATGTAEDDDNELGGAGKLSSTAKAGIIAGAVSGGLLVVGLAIFFIVRNRRKTKGGREESHPMLSQNKFGSVSTAGALEARSRTSKTSMVNIGSLHDDDVEVFNAGASLTEPEPKKRNWKPDTKWRPSSGFNWESPYEPPWRPPPPGQEDWVPLPLETAPATGSDGYQQLGPHREVFELASPDMQPPVEMSGSPLDPQRYSGVEWETTKTTKSESNDESKR